MPKKVKTRKQKILADSRRRAAPTSEKKVDSITYSIPAQKHTPNSISVTPAQTNKHVSIKTASYSYLSADLRRTVFLTLAITIVEIIIKFKVKGI